MVTGEHVLQSCRETADVVVKFDRYRNVQRHRARSSLR